MEEKFGKKGKEKREAYCKVSFPFKFTILQCGRMVLKHFQDKAAAAAKAEKEEEQRLRKVASFVAKEIRTFWSNVEKVTYFSIMYFEYFLIIIISCSWSSTSNKFD